MLRELATATGGRYLRSRTGGDLAKALHEIEAGERKLVGYRTTHRVSRPVSRRRWRWPPPPIAGLWLFL